MVACDDLKLGGTLSSAGITGGISINDYALNVNNWSNLLGSAGMSGGLVQINGRPGGVVAGDRLGLSRFPILDIGINDLDHDGGLTEATACEQKDANTDEFLGLITNPAGNYLEVFLADTSSRFIYVYNFDAALIQQPRKRRSIRVPLQSTGPFWREGGNESTDTITGADSITVGGNRGVYDAVLVFAGDGTFSHTGLGWTLEIDGSSGAVTVDLGARTVTEGGNPAPNLLRRNNRDWGWFNPGANAVTSDVSVVVTWRDAWA